MTSFPRILAAGLFALAACGPVQTQTKSDAGTDSTPDAGDTGPKFACDYPTTGYGSSVGKKLEPFALENCNGSGDYQFVNQEFCDAKFTVLSIAAGWCEPCKEESKILRDKISRPYADKGVRLVQILVQNPDYSTPTVEFCQEWVTRYGLENVELIDPDGFVEPYFPSGSLPSTAIVDSKGVIRWREDGLSQNLQSLRAALDKLIAEE